MRRFLKVHLPLVYFLFISTLAFAFDVTHKANDFRISYNGRFYKTPSGNVRCSYPNSEIRFRFTSDTVRINISQYNFYSNNAYFDILIDGKRTDSINVNSANWHTIYGSKIIETHTVSIVKRTEVWMGEAIFRGIELKKGSLEVMPESVKPHFLFIGASWESGFGNLPNLDFETSKTTNYTSDGMNSTLAYPALVATQLNAEHTCVCYAGKGLNRSYDGNEENQLPSLLFKSLAETSTESFDMQSEIPDLIMLNLGGNDFALDVPDKQTYTAKYIQTIDTLFKLYPKSKIIVTQLVLEPADTLANKKSIGKEIEYNTYVYEHFKNLGMSAIYFWKYQELGIKSWGQEAHPNRMTYQKMADSLVAFVRKNVVLNVTGISEYEELETDFRIFPNPSTGIVYLEGKKGISVVYTEAGQKLFETQADYIDFNQYTKGVYIVSHNGRNVRLIKQ